MIPSPPATLPKSTHLRPLAAPVTHRILTTLATATLSLTLLPAALPTTPAVDFARDIQPILNNHCTECHGGVKKKGGLSFTNRTNAMAEAKSGARAIVPGNLDQSELVHRITTRDEDDRMPPEEPLDARDIELLQRWIRSGADWPEHWAWKPVAKPVPPAVTNKNWPRNPVDHFILARLDREKIEPSPQADRRAFIRRLALDLTGLLPTPAEVTAFLADKSPDAYNKLVDQYLASPHFGERWARHWLDEARYADSAGYEKDSPRADAWHFRDWVINSINDDIPFDRFTVAQIAGDLLPDATNNDRIATKFNLMTQFNLEGGVDAEEDRTKRVIDRINTLGSVWLGASIGCTQCHDHPYDPITQAEFYRLYAFYNNTDWEPTFAGDPPEDADKRWTEREKKWSPIAELIENQKTDKNLSNKVQASLSQLRRFDNEKGFTRVVAERTTDRRPTYAFRRGDFLQPLTNEGEVHPDTPALWPALNPAPGQDEPAPANRLNLAHWLVHPDHPATARVTVNKTWMHLFGEPLVTQPQDLGTRGDPPLHPELLDWLAHHFIHDAQWSRKHLIKTIVTSSTYRQSSRHRADLADIDPDNRLFARQNRFRVEAEIIRDLFLQTAGLLSDKVSGPSVFPPVPADVAAQSYANNFKWNTSTGDDRYRRGMYTFYKRTAPDPNLVVFDCPDASISKQRRDASNTPIQALATLQNVVFHEAAQALAKRLLETNLPTDAKRINHAFHLALARPPAPQERAALIALLTDARKHYQTTPEAATELVGPFPAKNTPLPESAAWTATTRIILNLDEFLTRE